MVEPVTYPNVIISQALVKEYKRTSSELISYYCPKERLLHILDYDAVPLSTIRSPGIEVLDKVVKFTPHDFPGVSYLNLAESYYKLRLHKTIERERRRRRNPQQFTAEEQRSMFEWMNVRKIYTDLLLHILIRPEKMSGLVRSLIRHAEMYRCLYINETMPLTRLCLQRLHQQTHPDRSLVSGVLMTFSRTRLHKEELFSRNYTHLCLEYILQSCISSRFNIRWYLRHSPRGRILGFCPVRSCVHTAHFNFPKMKVLIQQGFEPLELNDNWRVATYLGILMTRRMQRSGLRLRTMHNHIIPHFYFNNRRNNFTMEFLYMVFASIRRNPKMWSECSKLFFDSIPDSFVSREEVRTVVRLICRPEYHEDIFHICETLFSETFTENIQPRTLKHHCRCLIRRILSNNYQLPEVLDRLNLPIHVIKYLKFED